MNELPAEQTWLVLVELLTDLRKKGIKIPKNVTKNIQMAKTVINFYKVDPTDPERQVEVKRINEFLTSAQDSLMTLANKFSGDYADDWMEKLLKASRGEEVYPQKKTDSKPNPIFSTQRNPLVRRGLWNCRRFSSILL